MQTAVGGISGAADEGEDTSGPQAATAAAVEVTPVFEQLQPGVGLLSRIKSEWGSINEHLRKYIRHWTQASEDSD